MILGVLTFRSLPREATGVAAKTPAEAIARFRPSRVPGVPRSWRWVRPHRFVGEALFLPFEKFGERHGFADGKVRSLDVSRFGDGRDREGMAPRRLSVN